MRLLRNKRHMKLSAYIASGSTFSPTCHVRVLDGNPLVEATDENDAGSDEAAAPAEQAPGQAARAPGQAAQAPGQAAQAPRQAEQSSKQSG